VRIAQVITALLAVLVGFVFLVANASAAVYAGGVWKLQLDFGPNVIPCDAVITQQSSALKFDFECPPLVEGGLPIAGSITGQIDEQSGVFFVSGVVQGPVNVSFSGTVAGDGNSMSGHWQFFHHIEFSGTFTGVRNTPFTPETTPTPTPVPTSPSLGGVVVPLSPPDGRDASSWDGLVLMGALVLAGATWRAARSRSR
jgi:hypothetical protein